MSTAVARELAALVRRFDPLVVARGRTYAAQGRVSGLQVEDETIRAVVRGSSPYRVQVGMGAGEIDAECTCPAFERERQCKHLAAVAAEVARNGGTPNPRDEIPEVLHSVYSSSAFLKRLALYAGEPLAIKTEQWLPLYEWWRRPGAERVRDVVLEHAPAIARDLADLKSWTAPPTPLPGTVYAELYEALVSIYDDWRRRAKVRRVAPGPRENHPGWSFAWDGKRRVFEAREKLSPLLTEPHRFGFSLPNVGRGQPRLEDRRGYGECDAWDLFALRSVIEALDRRDDAALEDMAQDLGRATWDALLDKLVAKAPATDTAREWAFAVVARTYHLELQILSRKGRAWKSDRFDALYTEETASADERDIARIALCSTERVGAARLTFGTAQTHELLLALSRHPRVHYADERAAAKHLAEGPRPQLVAGALTVRLEKGENRALSPSFFVGETRVDEMLFEGTGAIRGGAKGPLVVSASIPQALRPWVDAARAGRVAFPPEAVPKLLEATQPLVASGQLTLPRDALGTEVQSPTKPALRVEWRPEGGAVVTVFVQVHPRAPLVMPGMGPDLFTFEIDGQRVFVERDPKEEQKIANAVRSHVPVLWDQASGRADDLQEAVVLADWLDDNPLGLTIEVTIGRRPVLSQWGEVTRNIIVQREGNWLVLDGSLDVKGAKLTLGDVLEAARLARRFVRAREGLFLELSKEAIDKLRPLAVAADLAPPGRLHPAFSTLVGAAFDDRELAAKFAHREETPKVPKITGTLRGYQRDGVAWMLRLASWAPGCVLADDMGLGKTVQTAAVLKSRRTKGAQLIVAPASVTSNWMSELARFVPELRARWFHEERELDALGPNDVVVVSYGLLGKLPEAHWTTVVVDEAQYVKNVGAQRTDAVRNLSRDFTICLTGTPLENHAGELFSIVDLAFPGLLGSEHVFRERFRKPIEGQRDASRLAVLGKILAPFLLRRTRKEVLEELPPREEVVEHVDLSPPEQKRYLALRKACEAQFAKRKKGETTAQLKIALLAALTRLRQLACDPALVDPTFEGQSTKITRAVELATELAAEGNRALVFSQFTTFLTKLKTAFEAAGLRVAYLAGDTPTAKRRAIVDAFQAGEYDIFCVSLLAGGTGLNLTTASYVIHTDPWWNPAAEEQATSRAHRMGQTHPVTVYRLVARGTIEEAVLDMHAKKRDLAAAVLEGKSEAVSMTPDELLALIAS